MYCRIIDTSQGDSTTAMKRIRGIVIVAFVIGLLTVMLLGRQSDTVFAIGIKPKVCIRILGADNQLVYGTFALKGIKHPELFQNTVREEITQKFNNFQTGDDYIPVLDKTLFFAWYEKVEFVNPEFDLSDFKVLLYLPNPDIFVYTSEANGAFSSSNKFTIDLSEYDLDTLQHKTLLVPLINERTKGNPQSCFRLVIGIIIIVLGAVALRIHFGRHDKCK